MKGILLQAVAACIFMSGSVGSAYSATGDKTTITLTINVTARTCQFDKASQSVELAPVRVEDFMHTSGIFAHKEVPVGISCSSNIDTVKINVKGEPAQSDNNVVHPALFRNTGSAKNIGLAFMDKNKKQISSVAGDGDSVEVELENGKATYLFWAGYGALTGIPHVSGGSFASSVNLTFDYE